MSWGWLLYVVVLSGFGAGAAWTYVARSRAWAVAALELLATAGLVALVAAYVNPDARAMFDGVVLPLFAGITVYEIWSAWRDVAELRADPDVDEQTRVGVAVVALVFGAVLLAPGWIAGALVVWDALGA